MNYQAKEKNSLNEFEEAFSTYESGMAALRSYEKQVIASKLTKGHPSVNWGMLEKEFTHKKRESDFQDRVPYEEEEWIRKMGTEKGWCRKDAKDMWDAHYNSGLYKIEKTGLKGSEEMWLPLKPVKRKAIDNVVGSTFKEGGKVFKNMKADDKTAFKHFVLNSGASANDDFLKGKASGSDDQLNTYIFIRIASSAC